MAVSIRLSTILEKWNRALDNHTLLSAKEMEPALTAASFAEWRPFAGKMMEAWLRCMVLDGFLIHIAGIGATLTTARRSDFETRSSAFRMTISP